MTIQSAAIVRDDAQAGGRRRVQYRYTDHLGGSHLTFPRLVEAGYDADADLLVQQSLIESQLAEQEFNQAIQYADVTVFQNPAHQTTDELVKRFVYYYQLNKDPIKAIELKPVTDWISVNYTSPGLRAATGLSVAQANSYNSKVGNIIGVASIVDSFMAYEAFD